jgi:hypothetical protein
VKLLTKYEHRESSNKSVHSNGIGGEGREEEEGGEDERKPWSFVGERGGEEEGDPLGERI